MLKVLELSDNLKRHALHEKNRKHLFNYFLSQLKSFRIKSTLVTIYESNQGLLRLVIKHQKKRLNRGFSIHVLNILLLDEAKYGSPIKRKII